MNEHFAQQVSGVSPEQTRAALSVNEAQPATTIVEQEQLYPALRPEGFGEDIVDRDCMQARLDNEHARVMQYQINAIEVHSRHYMNGELIKSTIERDVIHINHDNWLRDTFNIESSQARDLQEIELGI